MIRRGFSLWILVLFASSFGYGSPQSSQHAFIGVVVAQVPPDYSTNTGALIVRVVPGTPAESAGVLSGDVVTSWQGVNIADPVAFSYYADHTPPGPINLTLTHPGLNYRRLTVDASAATQAQSNADECNPATAEHYMQKAISSSRSSDFPGESNEARLAQNVFDACIAGSSSGSSEYIIRSADARMLQGSARLSAKQESDAIAFVSSARDFYTYVRDSESAPTTLRNLAKQKLETIAEVLPAVMLQQPRSYLVPTKHVPSSGAAQPSQDSGETSVGSQMFTIMSAWATTGYGSYQVLHVRINLHPSQTVQIVGSNFRIHVASPTGGVETVRGLDRQAPKYQWTDWSSRYNTTVARQDVDPNEDLGDHGRVTIQGGDASTYVVSFVIRSDASVNDASSTIEYAP